ncbi:MAG: P-II family nitrogen regulator, partial [Oscillospiraceae bacterium]
MKQIKAIIRPDLLDEVRKELDKLECCRGLMVSELVGHGTQNGITHSWGGEEYRIELLQKVCVDVVVKDDEVDAVTDAIIKSASIGQV